MLPCLSVWMWLRVWMLKLARDIRRFTRRSSCMTSKNMSMISTTIAWISNIGPKLKTFWQIWNSCKVTNLSNWPNFSLKRRFLLSKSFAPRVQLLKNSSRKFFSRESKSGISWMLKTTRLLMKGRISKRIRKKSNFPKMSLLYSKKNLMIKTWQSKSQPPKKKVLLRCSWQECRAKKRLTSRTIRNYICHKDLFHLKIVNQTMTCCMIHTLSRTQQRSRWNPMLLKAKSSEFFTIHNKLRNWSRIVLFRKIGHPTVRYYALGKVKLTFRLVQ